METVWKTLTGASLGMVLDWNSINRANQNLDESAQTNPTEAGKGVDYYADNRRDKLVEMVIDEVRGAIRSGGRIPLSVTKGCVPPTAERHVLNLAAWQLIMSTPNLLAAYMGDSGLRPVWEKFTNDAYQFIEGLKKGASVERPSEPTGQDYETEVSDTNPPIRGTSWGDMQGTDLEYEAGGRETGSGSMIPLPADDMRTY